MAAKRGNQMKIVLMWIKSLKNLYLLICTVGKSTYLHSFRKDHAKEGLGRESRKNTGKTQLHCSVKLYGHFKKSFRMAVVTQETFWGRNQDQLP